MASNNQRRRKGQPTQRSKRGRRSAPGVFTRSNYLLLLLGLAIITVGYVIMRLENEVDGFISLYIAPILILGGYLEIIYAIFYQPKDVAEKDDAQS